jgi:hypothetical protein
MATTGSGVGQFSFTLKQAADTTISMTWYSDAGATPVNLTGYSMALTIRAFVSSTVALLSLNSSTPTSGGSVIQLGGTAGTINLVFAHTDTAGLPASGVTSPNSLGGLPVYPLGVYDLQYTDPSGNVNYLLEGAISIDPRVT